MPLRPIALPSGWFVAMLLVLYAYVFVDRQIAVLLVDPLKADFRITDAEFSILHGSAFAVSLGAAGLVAGRLVDTRRRVTIVSAGLMLCAVLTLVSGLVWSYAGLMACRIGIGVGQSAFTPAAHSLIADRVAPRRLGLALGLYGMGPYIGVGLAYVIAGWAVTQVYPAGELLGWRDLRPWQLAFGAVGLAGALLALLASCLAEPERQSRSTADPKPPALSEVVGFFRENIAGFALLKISTAFASMATYAIATWYPSHLLRSFGWSPLEIATTLGPVVAITGALGVTIGGWASDLTARWRGHGRMLAMMFASALAVPTAIYAPLVSPVACLALVAATFFFATATVGINPSATMAMMPSRMRGVASALGVLIVNLLGLGVGPLAVALVSAGLGGRDGLGLALAVTVPIMLIASGVSAGMGLRFYARTVEAVRSGRFGPAQPPIAQTPL